MLPLVRRTMSARASMALLVGLLLAPVIASAVAANYYFLGTFNARIQQDALSVAQRVSAGVDREIALVRNALAVVGASVSPAGAAAPGSIVDTTEITRLLGIVLSLDRTGGATPDHPAVSGVRILPDGQAEVSLTIPVGPPAEGSVLTARLDPVRFAGLLSGAGQSPEWTVSLVGGDGKVIARSRGHENYVGRTATDDLLARTADGDQGVWIGRTLEGTEVLSAFVRSPVTGWLVAVGIPTDLVEQPHRRSLAWLAMVALVGFTGSIIVAVILGTRIAQAMGETAAAAKALVRAESPRFSRRTTLRELAEIDEALVATSAELERRGAARDRYERDLLVAAARVERILNTAPVGILEVDGRGDILQANEAAVTLLGGGVQVVGRNYADPALGIAATEGPLLAAEDMPVARALGGERVVDREIAVRANPDARVLSVNATPIERDGRIVGAIVSLTDVSTRHQAERRRLLLINELNHRVKNTLASVQAIVEQTLSTASTFPQAQEAIGNRLRAMAGAHDLLTRESWEGAELLGVVEAAVAPFRGPGGDRFRIDPGPLVRLAPRAALPVVLAVHELATNAVKYGALSGGGGTVRITWTIDGSAFVLLWHEADGPPVAPPTRKGFGSRLLERGLAMELDATVDLAFEATGLVCRLVVPIAGNTVIAAGLRSDDQPEAVV